MLDLQFAHRICRTNRTERCAKTFELSFQSITLGLGGFITSDEVYGQDKEGITPLGTGQSIGNDVLSTKREREVQDYRIHGTCFGENSSDRQEAYLWLRAILALYYTIYDARLV